MVSTKPRGVVERVDRWMTQVSIWRKRVSRVILQRKYVGELRKPSKVCPFESSKFSMEICTVFLYVNYQEKVQWKLTFSFYKKTSTRKFSNCFSGLYRSHRTEYQTAATKNMKTISRDNSSRALRRGTPFEFSPVSSVEERLEQLMSITSSSSSGSSDQRQNLHKRQGSSCWRRIYKKIMYRKNVIWTGTDSDGQCERINRRLKVKTTLET